MKKLLVAILMISAAPALASVEPLNLNPPALLTESLGSPQMLVGAGAARQAGPDKAKGAHVLPPPSLVTLSIQMPRRDALDILGNVIDLEPVEEGVRTQTDVLHLMLPARHMSPFAAIARENHLGLDDITTSRVGFGAGAQLKLSRSISLRTEVLLFPPDCSVTSESDKLFADVKWLSRLQISF